MRAGAAAFVGFAILLGAAVDAQRGRKVTGVVEDASSGRAVSGAEVLYEERGRAPQTTRTDGKGAFEIPNGSAGIVTVTARGYATSKRSWPPRESLNLRFEMTPPAVISGTLMDAVTRRGVSGRVVLTVRGRFHHVSKGATTDGPFRFVDLPTGPGTILAYADGFAPHYGELRVEAGKQLETSVGLLLEAAASGTVVGGDGTPVPGATVRVGYSASMAGADALAGFAAGHVMSDEEGTFDIRGLVPDTPIAMQAELDGRRSNVATIQVPPGMEQTGVVLQMP